MSHIIAVTEIPKEELPIIPNKTLEKTKRWIISKMQHTQKFPSIEWLSKKVGVSKGKTSIVMKVLLQDGFLLRKGNRYILAEAELDSFSSVSVIDKAKAALKLSPSMLILKGILFIIGAGATTMSILHSKDMLLDFYPYYFAVVCAILMIVFNILSAELGVFFYIKRHRGPCALFFFLLAFGTIFSMGSTVLGLYNSRTKDIAAAIVVENDETFVLSKTTLKHENILERKAAAKKDLDIKQARVNTLIPIVAAYTEKDKLFDDDNYRLILANRKLKTANDKYEEVMQEEKKFLATETVTAKNSIEKPKDGYVWIGETINMNPNTLQFALSCYPAIFYDIIAPVSFSIVLFLTNIPKKKARKKNKRRRKHGKK